MKTKEGKLFFYAGKCIFYISANQKFKIHNFIMATSIYNLLADGAMIIFYSIVICVALKHFRRLFFPSFARKHRINGIIYVLWLLFGLVLNHHFAGKHDDQDQTTDQSSSSSSVLSRIFLQNRETSFFLYDVILGCLGISLTLTATFDFRTHHAKVQNKASGALDQDATITFSEMIEHSFYQCLNLLQAIFLHLLVRWNKHDAANKFNLLFINFDFIFDHIPDALLSNLLFATPILLYFVFTILPWAIRPFFPVNHFSSNYKDKKDAARFEGILYFIKKYQYAILYKHALFHGLNLSVALLTTVNGAKSKQALVDSDSWRRYWLVLNTAYTFEFFLQTLVKKGYLKQRTMLILNVSLMVIGSAGAVPVLFGVESPVDWLIVSVSTILNFKFRGNEVRNCLLTLIFGIVLINFSIMNNLCHDVFQNRLFPVLCSY